MYRFAEGRPFRLLGMLLCFAYNIVLRLVAVASLSVHRRTCLLLRSQPFVLLQHHTRNRYCNVKHGRSRYLGIAKGGTDKLLLAHGDSDTVGTSPDASSLP